MRIPLAPPDVVALTVTYIGDGRFEAGDVELRQHRDYEVVLVHVPRLEQLLGDDITAAMEAAETDGFGGAVVEWHLTDRENPNSHAAATLRDEFYLQLERSLHGTAWGVYARPRLAGCRNAGSRRAAQRHQKPDASVWTS